MCLPTDSLVQMMYECQYGPGNYSNLHGCAAMMVDYATQPPDDPADEDCALPCDFQPDPEHSWEPRMTGLLPAVACRTWPCIGHQSKGNEWNGSERRGLDGLYFGLLTTTSDGPGPSGTRTNMPSSPPGFFS